MAELAIDPPIYLTTQPDAPIRTLEAALHAVRRYGGQRPDKLTEGLARRLEIAATPEEADEAAKAFRAWAEAQGILSPL
jgi:alkanesulfonate monooxygenase SsuD/methylene tetrahydromethanopterin reductase-like flavin-dependent oxidoreductase (luciferase family)